MYAATHVSGIFRSLTRSFRKKTGTEQELEVYFDDDFADELENWGAAHVWPEIDMLLSARSGAVLDLACGSGRAYENLKQNKALDYFGCDISRTLVDRALARGIGADRLQVLDATRLTYPDRAFDYVFSIGSLEHFTEPGIGATLSEAKRVCRGLNFHMVPVSTSGFNEGWITTTQSYWNNARRWWSARFEESFGDHVWAMESKWSDARSRGVWFICSNGAERRG